MDTLTIAALGLLAVAAAAKLHALRDSRHRIERRLRSIADDLPIARRLAALR